MMKIAKHRGWNQVRVTGDEGFRREAWIQAQAMGLEVKGYHPRDRDKQAAGDRGAQAVAPTKNKSGPSSEATEQRLKDAAVVVRRLITDPAAQARLIEHAYARVRAAIPQRSRDHDTDGAHRSERPRSRK